MALATVATIGLPKRKQKLIFYEFRLMSTKKARIIPTRKASNVTSRDQTKQTWPSTQRGVIIMIIQVIRESNKEIEFESRFDQKLNKVHPQIIFLLLIINKPEPNFSSFFYQKTRRELLYRLDCTAGGKKIVKKKCNWPLQPIQILIVFIEQKIITVITV